MSLLRATSPVLSYLVHAPSQVVTIGIYQAAKAESRCDRRGILLGLEMARCCQSSVRRLHDAVLEAAACVLAQVSAHYLFILFM